MKINFLKGKGISHWVCPRCGESNNLSLVIVMKAVAACDSCKKMYIISPEYDKKYLKSDVAIEARNLDKQ